MNDKSKQMIEIVKDIDTQNSEVRSARFQKQGFVEKKSLHVSSIDRTFFNNLKTIKKFFRKSKDLMCINADKGNISVVMRRSEFIRVMEELLNDFDNFEILEHGPLKKLKSNRFRMADNWRKRGLLENDTKIPF